MAQSILDSLVSPLIIHRALLLWFAAVAVVARCIDPFTMNFNSEASIETDSAIMNEYAPPAEHSNVDSESALTWPKQARKGENERPSSSSSLPLTSAKGGCEEKLTRMKIEYAYDIWSPPLYRSLI